MQQRTTDKKNDIIKKFKTRAFFKTQEKGESLFTKQKTKDNITFFKKSDSLSILAEGVITEKENGIKMSVKGVVSELNPPESDELYKVVK